MCGAGRGSPSPPAAHLWPTDEVGGCAKGVLRVIAAVEDVVAAGHGQREAGLRRRQLAAIPPPHVDRMGGAAEQRLQRGVPLRGAVWLLCHRRHVADTLERSGSHPSAGVTVWRRVQGWVGQTDGANAGAGSPEHDVSPGRSVANASPPPHQCRCGPRRNRRPRFRGGGSACRRRLRGAAQPAPREPPGALAP